MRDSYKLFIVGVLIVVGFFYYQLCPKYRIFTSGNAIVRTNSITGSMEIYDKERQDRELIDDMG
jgi:hypothetical protein